MCRKLTREFWALYVQTYQDLWLIQKYVYWVYCETWMRLCQAHCQENKRKVPESPLLTARSGWLTVYATPWSQKRGRHFGSLSFFRQYCGPVFGPGFWPQFWTTKEQTGAARRSWRPGFRPFAGASLPSAMQAAMDTHIHVILWGDMAQKLFWISEKGPLSRAARSHANLMTILASHTLEIQNYYFFSIYYLFNPPSNFRWDVVTPGLYVIKKIHKLGAIEWGCWAPFFPNIALATKCPFVFNNCIIQGHTLW